MKRLTKTEVETFGEQTNRVIDATNKLSALISEAQFADYFEYPALVIKDGVDFSWACMTARDNIMGVYPEYDPHNE